MELFDKDAAWTQAATHVRVLKISAQLAVKGSDDMLRQIFGELRRRQIALGIEAGLVLPGPDGCGTHAEGYSGVDLGKVAERIRALGGVLDYLAMDAPLLSGSRGTPPKSCRYAPEDIARQIVTRVRPLKAVFPSVQVGDIEVIGQGPGRDPGWIAAVFSWIDLYRQVSGEQLRFFHADVDWARSWKDDLQTLADGLHKRGIPFGIIYNGDPKAATDEDWTTKAEERVQLVENKLGLRVDQAVIQTWMPRPTHLLPETASGTMTNLVLRYARPTPTIAMRGEQSRITGQLLDPAGKPVANAEVLVKAADGSAASVSVRALAGSVPAEAATALFALRVNTECNCSEPGYLTVGPVRYSDQGKTASEIFPTPANSALRRTAAGVHVIAAPGERVALNTPAFAVSPGANFTAAIPLGASAASAGSGYVALIFLDGQGKEVRRDRLTLEAGEKTLGTTVTDTSGRFQLKPGPEPVPRGEAIRAEFPGNASLRGASATLH